MLLPLFALLVQVVVGGNAVGDVATSEIKEGAGSEEAGIGNKESEYTARIYNGTQAELGKFKSTAFVNVTWDAIDTWVDASDLLSLHHECTGTVIGHKWVLTSAHCLPRHYMCNLYENSRSRDRFIVSYNISIKVGCVDLAHVDCRTYSVESFEVHENAVYGRPYINTIGEDTNCEHTLRYDIDIALLKVKWKIKFDYNVGSIPIMVGLMFEKIEDCIALSFGPQYQDHDSVEKHKDKKLYYVTLTCGSGDFCKNSSRNTTHGDSRICAINGVNHPALQFTGDDGSALLCPSRDGGYVAVGVLNGGIYNLTYTEGCGRCPAGITYTSIAYVVKWITTTTNNDADIVYQPLGRSYIATLV